LQRGDKPAADIQEHHVLDAVAHLVAVAENNTLIVTHGNGPQVGMLALESANDPVLDYPFPFDVLGAQTQGMIGYWLAQALANALPARRVVALVTQTIVDVKDPAFSNPTKFVGRGYAEGEAPSPAGSEWTIKQDGLLWRRVVASPEPLEVVEIETIKELAASGTIVVCAGGGGIPVARGANGALRGVEAVIDKDLATAVIARGIDAHVMLLLTDVAAVLADYGTPSERPIRSATVNELRALNFPAGSMGPKVESACRFVEATGRRAAIGSFDDSLELLNGTAGTSVVASKPPTGSSE
jgi:carbamate kinase